MNRIEIINSLIKKNGYKSYLEIGVRGGDCIENVVCESKIGVDPDKGSKANVYLTSDAFFKANSKKFDIIFIDGLHHSEQVIKDIENSLKFLNDNGTIVMHDCLPTSKRMQEIPLQEQNEWTGDVWKAYLEYRINADDISMSVVDCDWGCGIIQKGFQNKLNVQVPITYENFVKFKKEWMNIISPEKFKNIYL